jgi:hypothetical protein
MRTKLSKQIVFNYIKNFCYSPVFSVVEVQITPEDISNAPFQFNSSTFYTEGAYIVKDNELYVTLRSGAGPWSAASIANTFSGEVRSGEKILADVDYGEYDQSRFAKVTIDGTLTVYEVINDRSGAVRMGFDTYAHAADYIRTYITWADYSIRVEQNDNEFTAYWDDHIMKFYEPEAKKW